MALSLSQNLCTLQRKLKEQEAALLGQTQVIELLQQELHTAENQNQVPGRAFYFFTLCVFVCVVDGAFVSNSEVTRSGFFWHQLSITKSAETASLGQVLELQVCVLGLQQVQPASGCCSCQLC